jgi:hypothetical protein
MRCFGIVSTDDHRISCSDGSNFSGLSSARLLLAVLGHVSKPTILGTQRSGTKCVSHSFLLGQPAASHVPCPFRPGEKAHNLSCNAACDAQRGGVEAGTAEQALELLKSGQGYRCHLGDDFQMEVQGPRRLAASVGKSTTTRYARE